LPDDEGNDDMVPTRLLMAALGLSLLTGCASRGEEVAAPIRASSPATDAAAAKPPAGASAIRETDWRNVTLVRLLKYGDVTFRNGEGANCRMLPGDAKPAYGHVINEEPAGRPATEDALVLVGCGDAVEQALIPVALEGSRRVAVGAIEADAVTGPQPSMTFTSYRIENGNILVTVKKPDGKPENRRYRWGGNGWERN